MPAAKLAAHGSDPLALREYDGRLFSRVLLCHAQNLTKNFDRTA